MKELITFDSFFTRKFVNLTKFQSEPSDPYPIFELEAHLKSFDFKK